MSASNTNLENVYSPWPHRIAVILAVVTFPLIWVGGLVTTYDAGMAVPDWPNTYGYNLFLYPMDTWLVGPWDLFIEHGHRLLGSLSGLVTILLVVAVWRKDPRRWMLVLAVTALALVIFQGLLGGIRVLAVDREVAKFHGCMGPAFFAFAAVMAVLTSRAVVNLTARRDASGESTRDAARSHAFAGIFRLGLITTLFAYGQLFLGANLRHIGVDASPGSYRTLVWLHLGVAFLVTLHVLLLWNRARRTRSQLGSTNRKTESATKLKVGVGSDLGRAVSRRLYLVCSFLLFITFAQVALGLGTWVVKFGWPPFMSDLPLIAGYMPVAKSMLQANIITAHVGIGSLILAISAGTTVRAYVQIPRRLPSTAVEPAISGAPT
jgi:cytochrome c oxidase assembly protein subunit 15